MVQSIEVEATKFYSGLMSRKHALLGCLDDSIKRKREELGSLNEEIEHRKKRVKYLATVEHALVELHHKLDHSGNCDDTLSEDSSLDTRVDSLSSREASPSS